MWTGDSLTNRNRPCPPLQPCVQTSCLPWGVHFDGNPPAAEGGALLLFFVPGSAPTRWVPSRSTRASASIGLLSLHLGVLICMMGLMTISALRSYWRNQRRRCLPEGLVKWLAQSKWLTMGICGGWCCYEHSKARPISSLLREACPNFSRWKSAFSLGFPACPFSVALIANLSQR